MPTTKTLREIRRAVKSLTTKPFDRRKRLERGDTPAKYSVEELAEFRRMLIRMKEDSTKQIRYLRESMGGGTGDELTAMFIQRELRVIASLETALMRIEEGTYGSCRSCGGFIERGRLEALPHTQLCLRCKGG